MKRYVIYGGALVATYLWNDGAHFGAVVLLVAMFVAALELIAEGLVEYHVHLTYMYAHPDEARLEAEALAETRRLAKATR